MRQNFSKVFIFLVAIFPLFFTNVISCRGVGNPVSVNLQNPGTNTNTNTGGTSSNTNSGTNSASPGTSSSGGSSAGAVQPASAVQPSGQPSGTVSGSNPQPAVVAPGPEGTGTPGSGGDQGGDTQGGSAGQGENPQGSPDGGTPPSKGPEDGTGGEGPKEPEGGTPGEGVPGEGPKEPETPGEGPKEPEEPEGGTPGEGPKEPEGGTPGEGPEEPEGGTPGEGPKEPEGGTPGEEPKEPEEGTPGEGPEEPEGGGSPNESSTTEGPDKGPNEKPDTTSECEKPSKGPEGGTSAGDLGGERFCWLHTTIPTNNEFGYWIHPPLCQTHDCNTLKSFYTGLCECTVEHLESVEVTKGYCKPYELDIVISGSRTKQEEARLLEDPNGSVILTCNDGVLSSKGFSGAEEKGIEFIGCHRPCFIQTKIDINPQNWPLPPQGCLETVCANNKDSINTGLCLCHIPDGGLAEISVNACKQDPPLIMEMYNFDAQSFSCAIPEVPESGTLQLNCRDSILTAAGFSDGVEQWPIGKILCGKC